jgi:hypothetical protein
LSRIVLALLTMTGRVTMLGISRWTEASGSYRTIQRFFAKTLPWASLIWLFVQRYLLQAGHEYVLAGDETVVTKAGKQTHGLDRLFSSIYRLFLTRSFTISCNDAHPNEHHHKAGPSASPFLLRYAVFRQMQDHRPDLAGKGAQRGFSNLHLGHG